MNQNQNKKQRIDNNRCFVPRGVGFIALLLACFISFFGIDCLFVGFEKHFNGFGYSYILIGLVLLAVTVALVCLAMNLILSEGKTENDKNKTKTLGNR